MKKIVILITFFLIQCNEQSISKKVSISGQIVTIQFDIYNLEKLVNNTYFYIDKNKFIHQKKIKKNKKNYLPTFKPHLHEVEGKILKGEINIINLGLILIEKLKKTKEYELINTSQTYINGIITLKRKDGKKIKITKNKNYPLIIKLL